MDSTLGTTWQGEPSLRQAGLIAGLAYLLTPTGLAEFYIYPHLVVPGKIEQTVQNIQAHQSLFAVGILCYLLSYVCDVVIAWALYYLLKPTSASLAMLASWFQLVYAAVGLAATLHLVTVLQLLNTPEDAALFGAGPLHAQIRLLLVAFRSNWGVSLVLFGAHLILVGYLGYKSGYIPKLVSGLVGIAGAGYVVVNLNSYLFPEPDLGYAGVAMLGELAFACWLWIKGWRIKEPVLPGPR